MMKIFKWVRSAIRIGMFVGVIAGIVGYIKSLDILPDYDEHKPNGVYEAYIKRPLDIALSLMAIIVLLPVMGVIAVLIKINLKDGPILFKQDRPGLNGEIFTLYKFRTMTNETDEHGVLLPDNDRLPAFGRKLRALSLDELPELFNILKGDMSIVGPRPLLIRYLDRYNETQARRHEVRPGLTGLAQASGRNALSWEDKFNYDVEYVDNITFAGDIKIIVDTALIVLKRDGINSDETTTMQEFMGNEE